jgi:hypothetical protein
VSALFTLNGTIFWSKFMWIQCLCLVALMHIVTGLMYAISYLIPNEQYVSVDGREVDCMVAQGGGGECAGFWHLLACMLPHIGPDLYPMSSLPLLYDREVDCTVALGR